ncbi:MAG: phenylalanine--tRNA ligase subunit alpha, partial [Pseudomonadota bacterium]|nr:phenylalanine--tRNA ligase subunit alpha [Pseudomonadota bacterium]
MNNENLSLQDLAGTANEAISAADSLDALEALRVRYLGKKGRITEQLKRIGSLPPESRKGFGQDVNRAKAEIQGWIGSRQRELEAAELSRQLEEERIDVTQPGRGTGIGSLHPIRRTILRMDEIFSRLGFDIAEGPEIESDYYNFEALNIPADHPARAMHDTFYVDDHTVLRTHTSPVQIRYMHEHEPP